MKKLLFILLTVACSATVEVPDPGPFCAERCINAVPAPDTRRVFFCACWCRGERNTGDAHIRAKMCRAYEKGMRDRAFIPGDI